MASTESMGTSKRLGRYIKLTDVYGNTYTYGHLKSVAGLQRDSCAPWISPEKRSRV